MFIDIGPFLVIRRIVLVCSAPLILDLECVQVATPSLGSVWSLRLEGMSSACGVFGNVSSVNRPCLFIYLGSRYGLTTLCNRTVFLSSISILNVRASCFCVRASCFNRVTRVGIGVMDPPPRNRCGNGTYM